MIDQFERQIDYLRVSATNRCNLNCLYCFAPGNDRFPTESNVLSLDELLLLVECFVELGVGKVRITGGEPLIRKGLITFIHKVARLDHLSDLSLTTNGTLLKRFAPKLKDAGVKRINVSLDTLNPEKFHKITGKEELDKVLNGIEEALRVGLSPLKINTVVMRGINEDELSDFVRLCLDKPIDVRFIELMPMGGNHQIFSSAYLNMEAVKTAIREEFELNKLAERSAKEPAEYYQIPQAMGQIGFISPVSHSFCHSCNRIRLTAEGYLRPCLALDSKLSFRDLVQTREKEKIKERIKDIVWRKPAGHEWDLDKFSSRPMFQIGG
jgi:cyclic pyranopterin phosphate synthase